MKITYNPCKGMADELNKYGVQFTKGESVEADTPDKFLACPYFSSESPKKTVKKKAAKKAN